MNPISEEYAELLTLLRESAARRGISFVLLLSALVREYLENERREFQDGDGI